MRVLENRATQLFPENFLFGGNGTETSVERDGSNERIN